MTDSRFVFEATPHNFTQLVLANSEKGPVFVNYWSPNAGPCMMLMPRLVKLADEYGGRFLLVTLNTDQHGRFARDQGVTSIPTTKVFRHGQAVDTLYGAESERSLRAFIERHMPATRSLDVRMVEAYQAGDIERAVSLAAQSALEQPENLGTAREIAKMLMLSRRYQQAHDLLHALPAEAKAERETQDLLAHLGFILAAEGAPPLATLESVIHANPDNVEVRYRLAAVHLLADRYEQALEQLFEVVQRDRSFRNDAGYFGMVAIFRVLGEGDARTVHYRRLLQGVMH